MSLAIEDAWLAKDEVGYVALHGTATVLNDKTETRAAKLCFGKACPRAADEFGQIDDRPSSGSIGRSRRRRRDLRHERRLFAADDQSR